jgi:hypothetical protein
MVALHNSKAKFHGFFINHYPFLTRGCTLLWSFFGTGHGKRLHDGAKIVLKIFIKQAQLDASGPKL